MIDGRIVLVVMTLGTAGLAQAQGPGHSHGDMRESTMASQKEAASTKNFKAADIRMMKGMQVPYTGDADVDFRAHMIPHHQGAIDMAKVALEYAKDLQTKELAQKIIEDQEKEIADMQDWLKRNSK